MRVDEARHHDTAPDILVQGAFGPGESLVRASVPGRDDHPVPGGDESVVDRAHIAGRRAYPRTLILERLERQQARAPQDEIRLDHSRK